MTTVDKLREVIEALEQCKRQLDIANDENRDFAITARCALAISSVSHVEKAMATLAKVIEEMEKPTPWKSSPPYNGEL